MQVHPSPVPRPRPLWKRILWMAGLLLTFLVATGAAAFVAHQMGLSPLASAVAGQVVILTVVILFSVLDGDGFRSLGMFGPWKSYDAAVVPGIIILHFFGSTITAIILQAMQEDLSQEGVMQVFEQIGQQDPLAFLGYGLAISLLAGIGEELLFRGYLITRLERMGVPGWGCIVASALLFGLVHWPGYGLIPSLSKAFWFGIPTGIFFWYRRSLGPLIAAHALMDFLGFSAVYLISQVAPLVPGM